MNNDASKGRFCWSSNPASLVRDPQWPPRKPGALLGVTPRTGAAKRALYMGYGSTHTLSRGACSTRSLCACRAPRDGPGLPPLRTPRHTRATRSVPHRWRAQPAAPAAGAQCLFVRAACSLLPALPSLLFCHRSAIHLPLLLPQCNSSPTCSSRSLPPSSPRLPPFRPANWSR